MNPALGVALHAIGGFAAGSFYLPLKRIEGWAWESYWLINGVFAWLVMPWAVAMIVVPDLGAVWAQAPTASLGWAFLYGALWGIGGLTFGLTMRYLGLSLGYALALGLTAMFGTLLPPIYFGEFVELVTQNAGLVTLGGVGVTLVGIAITGWAGVAKDAELSEEEKTLGVEEFDLVKGVWVAVFAGIMSACMAFGIAAGEPIAEAAVDHGTAPLWQNTPVFIVIFAGGFLVNFGWCAYLNATNGTFGDYLRADAPRAVNYLFAAAAGITWYFQFMFYGMGTSQMGAYDFASWSIHFAFVIAFSNLWGLATNEWAGTSARTRRLIYTGLAVLVASACVIGYGNYLGQ
jgi:L-rhamnose-H+ transport protein